MDSRSNSSLISTNDTETSIIQNSLLTNSEIDCFPLEEMNISYFGQLERFGSTLTLYNSLMQELKRTETNLNKHFMIKETNTENTHKSILKTKRKKRKNSDNKNFNYKRHKKDKDSTTYNLDYSSQKSERKQNIDLK